MRIYRPRDLYAVVMAADFLGALRVKVQWVHCVGGSLRRIDQTQWCSGKFGTGGTLGSSFPPFPPLSSLTSFPSLPPLPFRPVLPPVPSLTSSPLKSSYRVGGAL